MFSTGSRRIKQSSAGPAKLQIGFTLHSFAFQGEKVEIKAQISLQKKRTQNHVVFLTGHVSNFSVHVTAIHPENRGNSFLRNVDRHLLNFMASNQETDKTKFCGFTQCLQTNPRTATHVRSSTPSSAPFPVQHSLIILQLSGIQAECSYRYLQGRQINHK